MQNSKLCVNVCAYMCVKSSSWTKRETGIMIYWPEGCCGQLDTELCTELVEKIVEGHSQLPTLATSGRGIGGSKMEPCLLPQVREPWKTHTVSSA